LGENSRVADGFIQDYLNLPRREGFIREVNPQCVLAPNASSRKRDNVIFIFRIGDQKANAFSNQ